MRVTIDLGNIRRLRIAGEWFDVAKVAVAGQCELGFTQNDHDFISFATLPRESVWLLFESSENHTFYCPVNSIEMVEME